MGADSQGVPSQAEGSAPIWRWEVLSNCVDKTLLSGIKEKSSIQGSVYRKSSHLGTCSLTQRHLAFAFTNPLGWGEGCRVFNKETKDRPAQGQKTPRILNTLTVSQY